VDIHFGDGPGILFKDLTAPSGTNKDGTPIQGCGRRTASRGKPCAIRSRTGALVSPDCAKPAGAAGRSPWTRWRTGTRVMINCMQTGQAAGTAAALAAASDGDVAAWTRGSPGPAGPGEDDPFR